MAKPHTILLPLCVVLACAGAPAPAGAGEGDPPKEVHINAIKDPEMRSYRAVVAGLDTYDEFRQQLAPAATGLRFHFLERNGKDAVPAEGLALRIASDDESFPIAVDGDGMFVVPRIQAAWDSKADIVVNRKKGKFQIIPEVRTAGLADNVRRLGDLRLECKVRVAILKEEIPFWANTLINGLLLTTDWCSWFGNKHGEDRTFGYSSALPVAAATLASGERTLGLKVSERGYQVPVGDTSWPDDALVELKFAEQ